jgi:hypothetical protein
MKRFNLGVNVLTVLRELIGDINQLVRDDPTDAAGHRDRNQDGCENGYDTAGVQPLEKRHRWSQ